ncbi:lytic transglycosylase domain-containing protein [Sphingomonas sp. SORGH_AS_0950]|uniref:lytic transglycosylase domain-containing protein n=1 Tax=Sphingomonas sp. SORGH_AS_0950 TaxID=3041792 RepID=UPI0027D8AB96|nr:lytic transglycosylase domain-containing protein [Sphingomonas sp. SORGH_AS_0950]
MVLAASPLGAAVPVPPIRATDTAAPPTAIPSGVARWQPYIEEAAQRFGVPIDWIAAIMAAESGGETMRDGRPIVSRAGAMGLMQLMPATWTDMRNRYGLGGDPHDPHDNILAGTAYLRLMYDRFGYPGLFGAYNAGPRRYADHLATRTPLPTETRAYVARLASRPATPAMPPATLFGERLFFPLGHTKPDARTGETEPHNGPSTGLFVPLTPAPSRDR